MGINAKLADITAATSPTGGELIYIEQGDKSRRLALGAVGAKLLDDTGYTGALTSIGVTAQGRALLDDTGGTTMLTTLGVTALGRALLDDTGQTTMLTTLGGAATGIALFKASTDDNAIDVLNAFTPSHTGGAARTLRSKIEEMYSVSDFGAITGSDDTATFQAAADAASSVEYQTDFSTVLKAPVKYVRVPAGTWILTSAVTAAAKIVWVLESAAEITGVSYLSGTVLRSGIHVNAKHTGIMENATTVSFRAGRNDLDYPGGVYGITSLDAISVNGAPHSVTVQIDNDTTVTPISMTGTTYTSTTLVYTDAVDLGDVKTGASITTFGATQHTAIITGIDEGTKTITVSGGWRPFTGVSGATGTPTNGDTARIDYFGKIWGQNTNMFLRSGHSTAKATGYEMGLLNYQSNAPVFDPTSSTTPIMWGYDAVNLGTYKSSVGFLARGGPTAPFRTGMASYGNEFGFAVYQHATHVKQVGFEDASGEGIAFRATIGGVTSFSVAATGSMEIGRQDSAASIYIDFHADGATTDFNARIIRLANTDGALNIENVGTGNLNLVSSGTKLSINNTGVGFFGTTPAAQKTMAAATGTATRTTFATSTVTTAQLAERVKALIDDLRAYGLEA